MEDYLSKLSSLARPSALPRCHRNDFSVSPISTIVIHRFPPEERGRSSIFYQLFSELYIGDAAVRISFQDRDFKRCESMLKFSEKGVLIAFISPQTCRLWTTDRRVSGMNDKGNDQPFYDGDISATNVSSLRSTLKKTNS
jgi:hypothetical protein